MSRNIKASLLFFFFSVCGSSFFVAHQLRERAPVAIPHDLFAIVNEQVTAFRAADFQSAYRHAATGVQRKFTLPQFEKMVRNKYPEMTRARRVEFGLVKMESGSALVQVFFFADDGSVRSFLFSLVKEGELWKSNSVDELQAYPTTNSMAGTQA